MKKIIMLFLTLIMCFSFAACGNGNDAIDYSNAGHWLALPTSTDKDVDIFYLYPIIFWYMC